MSTTETQTHPIIRARDDDGTWGWDIRIEAMDHTTILEGKGANIVASNNGETLLLSVRSDRTDFEHDYLYLLSAELVPSKTTWFGGGCEISGVLTEFLWRTEEDVDQEILDCPSGDGIYVPKGPISDSHDRAWFGTPTPMLRVKVRISGRRS